MPMPTPTLALSGGRVLALDRPRLVGILNVTPDSFSDGGRFTETGPAVDHALAMLQDGADLIDIGGESTRPGAARVDPQEQRRRTEPVIRALLRQHPQALLSIDTTHAPVAAAALDAGAVMVNDISAGGEDPHLLPLAAARGAAVVLMHMRGQPATMQQNPTYRDVVSQVTAFLRERAHAALAAGLTPAHLVLDPGIGFGKTSAHNWTLIQHLHALVALGFPIMLGTSRKRFLRELADGPESADADAVVAATAATTALGAAAGVRLFRVHDVRVNRSAAAVGAAVILGRRPEDREPGRGVDRGACPE
jgi:dihydropteroate synthase